MNITYSYDFKADLDEKSYSADLVALLNPIRWMVVRGAVLCEQFRFGGVLRCCARLQVFRWRKTKAKLGVVRRGRIDLNAPLRVYHTKSFDPN